MKKHKMLTGAVIIMVSMVFSLSCERHCVDCPKEPEPPPAGDYFVYFADDNQSMPGYIWVVSSATDSLIDSIPTPNPRTTWLDISPDGRYLAEYTGDTGIIVFDTRTKEIKQRIPPDNLPLFSNDGQYLLLTGVGPKSPRKYDLESGNLIDSDTLDFYAYGQFHNIPYLYGQLGVYDSSEFCIYDYEAMHLVKTHKMRSAGGQIINFYDMTISSDDKYFYFIIWPGKIYKWEIVNDSLVDSIFIFYGLAYGQLAYSPMGNVLLVSEASNGGSSFYTGTIAVIDPSDFKIHGRISTVGVDLNFPSSPIDIGPLAITPDGSKAYGVPQSIGILPPASFDIGKLTASSIHGLRSDYSSGAVVVGARITK